MQNLLKALLFGAIIPISANAQDTLSGTQATSITLSDDCYVLDGCYIISDNVVLTIDPGVTFLATADAALIVEPGGRIEAVGTANNPIVFTTVQTAGSRTEGFWDGLTISGKAPLNNGAINIDPCSSQQAGGSISNDNSGTLKFVQIHFAGQEQPLAHPALEAGLALLAVGSGTVIENVQVSNSATTGISLAGGSVDAKWVYLLDNYQNDLFITDGYTGNLQGFYAERRNANAHHSSGSNGVVIQNNEDANNNMPHTRPVISNFTIHGPLHCGDGDPDFQNALQLQNNARADIWNSFFGYYPENGVFIEDAATAQNTASNELNISSTSFTDNSANDYANNSGFTWSGTGCSSSMANWIENMTAPCSDPDNQFDPIDPAYDASFCGDYCDAQFVSDFTLDGNNTQLLDPDYTDPALSSFDELDFRGAIQDISIFDTWITVCPVDAEYCSLLPRQSKKAESSLYLYPNPTQSYTDVRFDSKTSGKATIFIMDKVTGRIWQQMDVKMEQVGKQQFRVPVRGLPKNIYILQVSTPGETIHGQLLVQ